MSVVTRVFMVAFAVGHDCPVFSHFFTSSIASRKISCSRDPFGTGSFGVMWCPHKKTPKQWKASKRP